jgi:hypothetical protein
VEEMTADADKIDIYDIYMYIYVLVDVFIYMYRFKWTCLLRHI